VSGAARAKPINRAGQAQEGAMTNEQSPQQSNRRLQIRLGIAAVVGVLVLVFVLENRTRVRMHYLGADFSAPLWLMLLVVAAVGVLIGFLLSWRRRHHEE
jgi:uncharacterized integral membrane protein